MERKGYEWIGYYTNYVTLSYDFDLGFWRSNYINPGYGLSLVDPLWNASSYRQPLEQEGNPMT